MDLEKLVTEYQFCTSNCISTPISRDVTLSNYFQNLEYQKENFSLCFHGWSCNNKKYQNLMYSELHPISIWNLVWYQFEILSTFISILGGVYVVGRSRMMNVFCEAWLHLIFWLSIFLFCSMIWNKAYQNWAYIPTWNKMHTVDDKVTLHGGLSTIG